MAMMRLTDDEKARIHEAALAAEARIQARFALVIVPLSDRYLLFPVVWAAGIALFAGAVMALLWPHLGLRMGILIEVLIFAGLALSFDWLPLRLALVPSRVKRDHARALARHEFAARILGAREHRGGLIFFVSLGERYVELIADRDLHARVGEEAWNKIVADFVAAAKANRTADGFVAAATACADVLTAHKV
jgi:putative membrane protein